jgi:hypothetical protein
VFIAKPSADILAADKGRIADDELRLRPIRLLRVTVYTDFR